MVEQARARCPVCRSAVPMKVLLAVGDIALAAPAGPRCPPATNPAGVLGKTLALLQTDSRATSPARGLQRRSMRPLS